MLNSARISKFSAVFDKCIILQTFLLLQLSHKNKITNKHKNIFRLFNFKYTSGQILRAFFYKFNPWDQNTDMLCSRYWETLDQLGMEQLLCQHLCKHTCLTTFYFRIFGMYFSQTPNYFNHIKLSQEWEALPLILRKQFGVFLIGKNWTRQNKKAITMIYFEIL